MVIFPLEGCNLHVAGQNLVKKCPERFTDLPKLLKTEHYNDVLVISYSSGEGFDCEKVRHGLLQIAIGIINCDDYYKYSIVVQSL